MPNRYARRHPASRAEGDTGQVARAAGTGLAAGLALLCAAALTGCTVPVGGVAGVTVDAAGAPVAVVAVCEGYLDDLELYTDNAGGTSDTQGSWAADHAVTEQESVSLASPGRWRTREPLTRLRPGKRYMLYGATHDNVWSTLQIDFTVRDLRRLRPGTVLYPAYSGRRGDFVRKTTSVAGFRERACHDFCADDAEPSPLPSPMLIMRWWSSSLRWSDHPRLASVGRGPG